MSGDVSDKKRLISITRGNIGNHHLYLSGHHDFFPPECYGQSSKKKGTGRPLVLIVEGIAKPVETDIASDHSNGTPRNFFRKRGWTREFFRKHDIREGDVIAIERVDKFTYRISPFEAKNVRAGAEIPGHWPPMETGKPTAIDLFAGCGGFSIGLKKAGFQNLLAVEWDASSCETFKAGINFRCCNRVGEKEIGSAPI